MVELIEIINPEEESMLQECLIKTNKAIKQLESLELEVLLSGKYDISNALISIHAGSGGTEAMDWASMLLRMYIRYAERHDFGVSLIDESRGEEAGIKSATIRIEAPYAYGNLKGEAGTHRLVRLSPFNAKNLRQTSFALVEVIPEITEDSEVEINPADLRIDTFRASGAGGQHVNKTDSAIRITHSPTGIVVSSQNERSQMQNKQQAMSMLRSKLAQIMEEESIREIDSLKGKYKKAEFGSQIRSYVLQPYTMVKDLRTNTETSQVSDVLDGNIDEFIESEVRALASNKGLGEKGK